MIQIFFLDILLTIKSNQCTLTMRAGVNGLFLLSLFLEHCVPAPLASIQFPKHATLSPGPGILQALFLYLEHVLCMCMHPHTRTHICTHTLSLAFNWPQLLTTNGDGLL